MCVRVRVSVRKCRKVREDTQRQMKRKHSFDRSLASSCKRLSRRCILRTTFWMHGLALTQEEEKEEEEQKEEQEEEQQEQKKEQERERFLRCQIS